MNSPSKTHPEGKVAIYSFVRFGDQLMLSPFIRQLLREKKDFRIYTNQQGLQIFGDSPLKSRCTYLPSFIRRTAILGVSAFYHLNVFNHKVDDFPKLAPWIPRSRFLEDLDPVPTAYDHRRRLFTGLAGNPEDACWIYRPEPQEVKQAEVEMKGLSDFAVLVLGSHPSKPFRNWPTPMLVAMVNEIAVKHGIAIVFLGGGDMESVASEVISKTPGASGLIHNLCGNYSYRMSAAIMERARFVIAPDTGLMHLGMALSKPVLSFALPRSNLLKVIPPVVRRPVVSVCVRPEEQFADCAWERWKVWVDEFLSVVDVAEGKKIEGLL